MLGLLLSGVLLGVGATALFDLWQWAVARMLGQPAPNLAPMGRWFWHLREGRVFHDDIGRAARARARDVVARDRDGRIASLTSFFGPLAPLEEGMPLRVQPRFGS